MMSKLPTHWVLFAAVLVFWTMASSSAEAQNLVWAKKLGGGGYDSAGAVAVDVEGNIYTTGFFAGTADFDPGPGVFNLSTPLNASNIYVSKLNSAGVLVWAKSFSSPSLEFNEGRSIAVDGNGSVYVIGQFSGLTDFDPGPGTVTLDARGQTDIFVTKLSSSGALLWAKRIGSDQAEMEGGNKIALGPDGSVYTTGGYRGAVDFDPGNGTFILPGTGLEAFILKLNSAGAFVWARSFYSAGDTTVAEGLGLALTATGSVYATGYFGGTVDFDPGPGTLFKTGTGQSEDTYVVKLSSSGGLIWAKQVGGNGHEFPFGGIALGPADTVYLSGYFQGIADFNPGMGTFNLTAKADDIFVAKFGSAGGFLWAKRIGSNQEERGLAMAVDATGNVYTTGFFPGTVDFDPGPGVFNLSNDTLGRSVFVSKLNGTGSFVWAVKFGSPAGTKPRPSEGHGVALDESENVITTGFFFNTVDFDPGPGTFNMFGMNGAVFVAKVSQP